MGGKKKAGKKDRRGGIKKVHRKKRCDNAE